MKKILLFYSFLCAFFLYSIDYNVDILQSATINTGRSIPFWMSHGTAGMLDGLEDSLYSVSEQARLRLNVNDYLQIGTEVLLSSDDTTVIADIPQTYLRFSYLGWRAFIGKMPFTIGNQYDPLSSGSMIQSGNSQPIPRVAFGTDGYWIIPFTKDFLSVNALISHGWLDNNRSTKNAYLHEKYVIGKINLPYVSPFFGLVHEAMWGGDAPEGSWPDSFDAFRRVFFIERGGDDAPIGEQINRLGSHLGIWDMGLYFDVPSFVDGQLYYQHYFEANSSAKFNNLYDGLWGLHVHLKDFPVIDHILYEALFTKYQGGDVSHEDGGRQMYYENGMYTNGWTYRNYILGNPFITTVGKNDDLRIVNNRVIAHHIGISGTVAETFSYSAKYTFSMNYGRYYFNYDSRFDQGPLMQNSVLLSALYQLNEDWDVSASLSFDIGDMYRDSFGLGYQLTYHL